MQSEQSKQNRDMQPPSPGDGGDIIHPPLTRSAVGFIPKICLVLIQQQQNPDNTDPFLYSL